MGLLDGTTNKEYYEGNDLGNYQFTSLADIINQFMVVYVGENKMIPTASKVDVAFHAQRALRELSFDTLKSVKSQQIDLPATLVMPLPHDYVNYTKLSWADSAGIKHPLYPTSSTSNPFQIRQENDGGYSFPEDNEEVVDGGFDMSFDHWLKNDDAVIFGTVFAATSEVSNNKLQFSHRSRTSSVYTPAFWGHAICVYQALDVSDKNYVTLSATGAAVDFASNGAGILRVGLSTSAPDTNTKDFDTSNNGTIKTTNSSAAMFDLVNTSGDAGYLEWTTSSNTAGKEIVGINVSNVNTVYVIALSFHDFDAATSAEPTLTPTNSIDTISVINSEVTTSLSQESGNESESSTWKNYKANTLSENQDDYQDDTYWPLDGSRYGLDPQHAQANGSFYIDPRLGRIHFSSNISGKTVILDYISDSLGTDDEMQVHKFAEDAMYKWITHAVLSTRANTPEYLVSRFKRERSAAKRNAKLRLSNIKLEELTQTLRGKSKVD